MKILLITSLLPNPQEPLRGTFVADLARELKKKCHLLVISPLPWFPKNKLLKRFKEYYKFSSVPYESEIEGIKIYYPKYIAIPKMGFSHSFFIFISIFFLVAKLKKKGRFDLINAHWVFPDAVATSWVAKILQLPIIISAHGSDINSYSKFKLRRPQIIWALKYADKTTVVSAAQKKSVVQNLGIQEEEITVINNGVNFGQFDVKEKEKCRKKLGLESKTKTILFVGHIIEVKGLKYLINAVSQLITVYKKKIKVIAIGEGPLRPEFERKLSELNIEKNINFVGTKSREEIPYWFGACDLFCLPSIMEGFPCVILEALACGRPVVASRVGGIPELINEKNGILFEPRNVKELRESLLTALEKKWDEHEIVNSISNHAWANAADQYLNVYSEIYRLNIK